MPGPLTGWRVLNTRPADRAAALDAALAAEGAAVVHLPLLEVMPLSPAPEQRQWLMDLDRYRAVFVVSPSAAEQGLRLLGEFWPQWPIGPVWIAVGAATAAVLADAGITPQVPSLETSEGVLAMPAIAALEAGDRVLVLRGEGGRNLVRDWLQSRAVRVDYMDLYRRRLPPEAVSQWQAIRRNPPDAVILTSGESLRNWLAVAGAEAHALRAVVVSDRLADLAREHGLTRVRSAGGASPGAVVAALRSWRQGGGHGID